MAFSSLHLLFSAAAALVLLASSTLPSTPGVEGTDDLPAALAAGDECPTAEPGSAGVDCALSALQRLGHGVLRAQQEPAGAYQQCGGQVNGKKWTGPTACVAGFVCAVDNEWYAQCQPEGQEPNNEPDETDEPDEPDEPGEPKEPVKPVPLKPNPPTPQPKAAGPTNPIIIRGNFMYDSVTGKRFFAKGVAYNPRNTRYDISWGKSPNCTPGNPPLAALSYAADVIADELEEMWQPALRAIANLGANVVRIYNVDPANNHAKFMDAAAALGLYVIIPLTRKDWGYLPAFPSPDCYTKNIENYGNVGVNLLTSGKLIVKEFSQYNNTLLFTIANEMTVNDKNGFAAFPCVKAYTRDIHRYQSSCAMRRVPLIYADMDIGHDRTMVGEYMTCEVESPDDVVDAYGINVYSWCDDGYQDSSGKDDFNYSPYYDIKEGFKNFGKPVLFTEFGCNVGEFGTKCPYEGGRTWPQVKAIVEVMGEVLSGAIAFEFSMEDNEFGLTLTPGFLAGQDDLYLLDNYFALQKEFNKYSVSDKWNAKPASKAESCGFLPTQMAPLATEHLPSKCPGSAAFEALQRSRGVDHVSNWDELPPSPLAPLANVDNQTECPASTVSLQVYREGCCHKKCAQ